MVSKNNCLSLRYMRPIINFILLMALFAACSRQPDPCLMHVAEIVSEQPEEALAALDSINQDSLSNGDRHYYDFLTIKARDKAYVTHTSDSLYLSVLDYYSDHNDHNLLPEVLYYGGRVYSDLGDYPTALTYFHQALDQLPEGTPDLDLRKRVLSQTGRLFTNLRLYNEAIPYIIENLKLNRQLKDTTNIIYNLQLLGTTYLSADSLTMAEKYVKESLDLSNKRLLPSQIAKAKMHLAAVKYKANQIDSALILIRNVPETVSLKTRNNALAYASKIYLAADNLDSAYFYSLELINSQEDLNKEIGYQVILSPKLRNYLSNDAQNEYLSAFCSLLENYYDKNESLSVINRENQYDYKVHDREKIIAQKSNEYLLRWLIVSIFLIVILCLVVLILKNRNKSRIIKLHRAINDIKILNKEFAIQFERKKQTHVDCLHKNIDFKENITLDRHLNARFESEEEKLRENLRNEIMLLVNQSNHKEQHVDATIVNSKIYRNLLELIQTKTPIRDNDDQIWIETEKVVIESSPNFKYNLNLLTQGKVTKSEYRAALLVKCGFRPNQMMTLIGRSHGAIISRRKTISIKVFGEQVELKTIDSLIRLL